MRKSRFAESQIVGILKEEEAGVPVADLARKHGIARNTYFRWKARTYRTEVLDGHLFATLAEVVEVNPTWQASCNAERPHDSLSGVPSLMFLPRPTSIPESLSQLSA